MQPFWEVWSDRILLFRCLTCVCGRRVERNVWSNPSIPLFIMRVRAARGAQCRSNWHLLAVQPPRLHLRQRCMQRFSRRISAFLPAFMFSWVSFVLRRVLPCVQSNNGIRVRPCECRTILPMLFNLIMVFVFFRANAVQYCQCCSI